MKHITKEALEASIARGLTDAEMGADLGVTAEVVKHHRYKHGLYKARRTGTRFGAGAAFWTRERVESDLKPLWEAPGISARDIAEQLAERYGLALTKNAVICAAHRAGLGSRPAPKREFSANAVKAARKARSAAKSDRDAERAREREARRLQIEDARARRSGEAVYLPKSHRRDELPGDEALALKRTLSPHAKPFLDLAHGECRYIASDPLDDGAEIMACGAPAVGGSSYCACHHALCYRPSGGVESYAERRKPAATWVGPERRFLFGFSQRRAA